MVRRERKDKEHMLEVESEVRKYKSTPKVDFFREHIYPLLKEAYERAKTVDMQFITFFQIEGNADETYTGAVAARIDGKDCSAVLMDMSLALAKQVNEDDNSVHYISYDTKLARQAIMEAIAERIEEALGGAYGVIPVAVRVRRSGSGNSKVND